MIYIAFAECENTRESQHENGRSLLASLLSSLGYGDVKISTSPNGRPYSNIEKLDFSVSHSENCVAVGVICEKTTESEDLIELPFDGQSIGIDIEKITETFDLSKSNRIAKRFLGCEISSNKEFFRLWTENEAYGKMTGEGVISQKDIPCHNLNFTVEFSGSLYSLSIVYR